ncbi:lysostaphin resistance A-like protein [Plantactinospora sp. CA-290183]|uniref:CPBP family intramembrane glutamic endopeptidase n=1 Tax=Plantactinospora sp. CA-290183 TaxID=3240006 RepID=UPI003D8E1BA6
MPVLGYYLKVILWFGVTGLGLPLALLAVRWIDRRPVGTLSSVAGRLRWRLLVRYFCYGAAVLVPIQLFLAADGLLLLPMPSLDGHRSSVVAVAITLLVLLAAVAAQTSAEEYICRGLLMQTVGTLKGSPWPAILVQTAFFVGMHARHGIVVPSLIFVTSLAVAGGLVTVRTGGLEAMVAFHFAGNGTSAIVGVFASQP